MKVRFSLWVRCAVLSIASIVSLQAMTSPTQRNKFFRKIIVDAAERGDIKGVQDALNQVLQQGFNINYQDDEYQETTLHRVLAQPTIQTNPEAVNLVKALLAAGAKPNLKNFKGNTPLHFATNPAIIRELVKAGADVNARNDDSNTPLMEAANSVTIAAVQTLLTIPGVDIMAKNNEDKTAFDIVKEDQYAPVPDKQEMLQILAPYYTTLRGLSLDYIRKHRDKFTDEQIKKLPLELQEALQQQPQQ